MSKRSRRNKRKAKSPAIAQYALMEVPGIEGQVTEAGHELPQQHTKYVVRYSYLLAIGGPMRAYEKDVVADEAGYLIYSDGSRLQWEPAEDGQILIRWFKDPQGLAAAQEEIRRLRAMNNDWKDL